MNWKRSFVAIAFAVPIIALLAWGFRRDPDAIPSPLPGQTAPEFALSVFSPGVGPLARPVGDTVRLADLNGKIVVMNFWASWCLVCREEHATLSAMVQKYARQPVTFLGVLYNDEPANGIQWIQTMGGQSYPSVFDPNLRTAIDYGLYGVPETFVIDASGRIAHKETGVVSGLVLSRVLDSLIVASGHPAPKPAA